MNLRINIDESKARIVSNRGNLVQVCLAPIYYKTNPRQVYDCALF